DVALHLEAVRHERGYGVELTVEHPDEVVVFDLDSDVGLLCDALDGRDGAVLHDAVYRLGRLELDDGVRRGRVTLHRVGYTHEQFLCSHERSLDRERRRYTLR